MTKVRFWLKLPRKSMFIRLHNSLEAGGVKVSDLYHNPISEEYGFSCAAAQEDLARYIMGVEEVEYTRKQYY